MLLRLESFFRAGPSARIYINKERNFLYFFDHCILPAPRTLAASAFARPAEALFSGSRRPLFACVPLSGIDGARPWRRSPIFVGICRCCPLSGGACRLFQALLLARRSTRCLVAPFVSLFRALLDALFGALTRRTFGCFVRSAVLAHSFGCAGKNFMRHCLFLRLSVLSAGIYNRTAHPFATFLVKRLSHRYGRSREAQNRCRIARNHTANSATHSRRLRSRSSRYPLAFSCERGNAPYEPHSPILPRHSESFFASVRARTSRPETSLDLRECFDAREWIRSPGIWYSGAKIWFSCAIAVLAICLYHFEKAIAPYCANSAKQISAPRQLKSRAGACRRDRLGRIEKRPYAMDTAEISVRPSHSLARRIDAIASLRGSNTHLFALCRHRGCKLPASVP